MFTCLFLSFWERYSYSLAGLEFIVQTTLDSISYRSTCLRLSSAEIKGYHARLLFFFLKFVYLVFMCVHVYVPRHMCHGLHMPVRGWLLGVGFLLLTMRVLGIEHKSSGLVARTSQPSHWSPFKSFWTLLHLLLAWPTQKDVLKSPKRGFISLSI